MPGTPIALPQPADAVLFDLDGTIVDSRVPYTRSMNHALAEAGLPTHAPEDLYQYLGPPIHETLLRLAVPPELVGTVLGVYRERYERYGLSETTIFEGIGDLLENLHGRVPLAVATSKVSTTVEPLLELLGLRGLFDTVAAPLPEAVSESKAATITTALAGLGGPARAVMVGDRSYDVVGAHEHAIPTIGVLWGVGGERELREAGAAALVRAPSEIPPLIGL
jgi:phosphoglycolate phosphatase